MRTAGSLRGVVISLIFSSAAGAAESGSAGAPPGVARAARPGCAKLMCQRRAVSEDRGSSVERSSAESGSSRVSLVMGLGAGAVRGPAGELGLYTLDEGGAGDAAAPPGSAVMDGSGGGGTYRPLGVQRTELDGPMASLGVSLAQPLLDARALGLGVEERFTLAALLSYSGGSYIAGVGDFLLVASQPNLPVEIAVGPSLTVASVDVEGVDADSVEEPVVFPSLAALLRLDLTGTLPGTLDLVGHYGKSLNYEGSSYRDLQLALALEL